MPGVESPLLAGPGSAGRVRWRRGRGVRGERACHGLCGAGADPVRVQGEVRFGEFFQLVADLGQQRDFGAGRGASVSGDRLLLQIADLAVQDLAGPLQGAEGRGEAPSGLRGLDVGEFLGEVARRRGWMGEAAQRVVYTVQLSLTRGAGGRGWGRRRA